MNPAKSASPPLVTAVVRTYNRADGFGRSVDTVLQQSFRDFELIIMDDCSRDHTAERARAYERAHDNIRYIRHETNRGPGAAFNTAIAAARGRYIAFLDDDDLWRPDKLENQLRAFAEADDRTALVNCGVQYWDGETDTPLHTWIPTMSGDVYWQALGSSGHIFGPPSAVMMELEAVRRTGPFREDMPRGCCQQYYRRLAREFRIRAMERIGVDYYYHKDAITYVASRADVRKDIVSRRIRLDTFAEDMPKVPEIYARELGKMAELHFRIGEIAEARAYLRQAAGYASLTRRERMIGLLCTINAAGRLASALLWKGRELRSAMKAPSAPQGTEAGK